MDFWELSKILLRRWLVFVPLAVLAAVAAVLASGQVQPTFSAQASVILLPPLGSGTNAYVSLGIPTERVTIVSKGEEQPFCNEENESCWQQNRRGHFIFTAK